MTNSLRGAIRGQASSGLIVWLPALAGWLLLYWGATNMGSPAARLTMPMSDWSCGQLARSFHHVGGDDGGDDASNRHADGHGLCDPEPSPERSCQDGRLRRRLRRVVDGVRRGGDGRAMDVAGEGPFIADDCQHVARAQRSAAHDRGRLSVHAAQAGLPSRLPLAARLSFDRLARRALGRRADGGSPRPLLPRLLLGADGPAVCRRGDESLVDRRAHPSRRHGEARPEGRDRWRRRWASS